MIRRLRDWLRFQGWRNVYWREDAAMSRCDHTDIWYDDVGGLCLHCGRPMGTWQVESDTGTSSTTTRVRMHIRTGDGAG